MVHRAQDGGAVRRPLGAVDSFTWIVASAQIGAAMEWFIFCLGVFVTGLVSVAIVLIGLQESRLLEENEQIRAKQDAEIS